MKAVKAILAAVLFAWTLPLAAQVECVDNGHYFEFVAGGVNWDTAKTAAEGMSYEGLTGYLATITSAEENACVKAAAGTARVWLGGNDMDVEGTWVWITGEDFNTYTNWNTGEPNDVGGEDCLEMRGGTESNWNDIPCGFTTMGGYVVEYEPLDISVTGTDNLGVDPVIAGSGTDNISYTFTVANSGPDDATGLVITADISATDEFGIGCVLLPATGVIVPTGPASIQVTWPAMGLGAGATADFDLTCTAAAETADGNVFTAAYSVNAVDQLDFDDTNDSATLSSTIEREFDLGLTVVDAPDPVLAGSGDGNLTHTFTLTRAGPSDAAGVTVDLTTVLPTGVAIVDNFDVAPSIGTFDGTTWTVGELPASANGTVGTLTVLLTVDYTAAACTDCVSVSGTASATSGTDTDPANDTAVDPTSIEVASDMVPTFATTIDFLDDNTASVTVTLSCNAGLPLSQPFDISEGSPVTFSMTDLPFTTPGTECEITLSGLDEAYDVTPASCKFEVGSTTDPFAMDGANSCDFIAAAGLASYTVSMNWNVVDPNVIESSYSVDITATCDADILTVNGSVVAPAMVYTGPLGDGESVVLGIDVTTGAATCSAVQDVTVSGVEPEASADCTAASLPAGGSAECVFTNTVFFEGIPTLSQYGMAIMALLMLGIGFVGFRRFV